MTVERERFLVDVSALARYAKPGVAERLDGLHKAGVVVTCSLMELKLLGLIRDSRMYARVAGLRRAAIAVLEMNEADIRRALEVQALLVERGEFRVSWTVLLVAAVAERHGVVVLHHTAAFALIAQVTGQRVEGVGAGMVNGTGRTELGRPHMYVVRPGDDGHTGRR